MSGLGLHFPLVGGVWAEVPVRWKVCCGLAFVLFVMRVFARVWPIGCLVRQVVRLTAQAGGTVKDLMGVGGALWSPSQTWSD
jgi:hypothetical protein